MLVLLYLFALLGLGASSVLLVDYLRPSPIFCDGGSGCDLVRQSALAELLGVKTPVYGVLFFAGVLLLALWPARRVLLAWTGAGLAGAVVFLVTQAFFIHAFCKFCVVVDTSIILLFGLAVATRRLGVPGRRHRLGAGLGAVAVALAPVLYARQVPPVVGVQQEVAQGGPAPEVIQRLQQPGVATIVEFTDFECPYCRRLHRSMMDVLKDYDGRVRVVRRHHPLTKIHPNAETAARAACCAEEVGKGDEMAELLYTVPPEELTSEGCEKLAAQVGLDVAHYRQCVASDGSARRLQADLADARAAGLGNEAPVFWIGETRYRGAQPPDVIRAGIERALTGR